MNDWRKRTLLLQAKIITLLLALFINLVPSTAGASEDNYDDWYQIEMIVFKQNKLLDSDEIWPLASLSYPSNIVKISDVKDLAPQTLQQLEDMLSYEALVFEEDTVDSGNTNSSTNDNYLFKSRSRTASIQANKVVTDKIIDSNDTIDEALNLESQLLTQSELVQENINIETLLEDNGPVAFDSLDKSEHQLRSIARSINRSPDYKILLHQAWRQAVVSEENSMPILVQTGKHFDDFFELDGTINISRSRFLHFKTDLWFTEFTSKYQQASIPLTVNLSPDSAKKYPALVNWESNRGKYLPVHAHRMVHSRRMRRSTLHYIDHPRFGILIQIEKFTPTVSE